MCVPLNTHTQMINQCGSALPRLRGDPTRTQLPARPISGQSSQFPQLLNDQTEVPRADIYHTTTKGYGKKRGAERGSSLRKQKPDKMVYYSHENHSASM